MTRTSLILLLVVSFGGGGCAAPGVVTAEKIIPSELGASKLMRKDFPRRKGAVKVVDEKTARMAFADYVAAVRELRVFVGSEFDVSQTVTDGKTVFSSMVLNANGNLFIFAERGKREVSAVTLDLNRMNPTPRETANPVDQ